MQREADWRHLTAAGIVLVLLLFAGWRVLSRSGSRPDTPAPAGPQARMQDAPEGPPSLPSPAR